MSEFKENGQVRLMDHLKISDPDSGIVLYTGRGVSNKQKIDQKVEQKDEKKDV